MLIDQNFVIERKGSKVARNPYHGGWDSNWLKNQNLKVRKERKTMKESLASHAHVGGGEQEVPFLSNSSCLRKSMKDLKMK